MLFFSNKGAARILRNHLGAVFLLPLSVAVPWCPAQAQSAGAVVSFDIPAQAMADALSTLAVQANLQIFFEQAPVAGLMAPAVVGSMSPQEALRALLTNTHLEFTQSPDGAFIVRPRQAMKAHRHAPSAAPTSVTSAPVVASASVQQRSAREAEGPWVLRARGVFLDPHNESDALTLGNPPSAFVGKDGTRTNGRWAPELDLEYFLSSHWSSELAINAPQVHDLDLRNSTFGGATAGNFRVMPNFLTLKFNFNPDGVFRPYLGAGINVTSFYDVNAGPFGLSKTLMGPAAQGGFDIRLSEHWNLNADVKWGRIRPAVAFNGDLVGRMSVSPVLYGIGIGYRFGGSPAPTPVAATIVPAATAPAPPPDSDGDGIPDTLDKCPNTPRGVQVDATGCPLDSDNDGVPDYLDKCPGTPVGLKVDAQGCEIEELVLRGVTFQTNSAQLTAESAGTLDGVVAILAQRPNAKAEIHGYTDSRGSDALNQKLSERRAAAVAAYLVAHGIASNELVSRGFGKANPVATNDTAEGRAQNRRVTVEFSRPVAR
jgi:outer membrane protein OmpA-like peptidoglycan-associated protein/outer membrane protein W